MSEFHWKDGWFWRRLDDGSVQIRKGAGFESDADHRTDLMLVVPPNEWASIVASVAAGGEGPNYKAATDLHAGSVSRDAKLLAEIRRVMALRHGDVLREWEAADPADHKADGHTSIQAMRNWLVWHAIQSADAAPSASPAPTADQEKAE